MTVLACVAGPLVILASYCWWCFRAQREDNGD